MSYKQYEFTSKYPTYTMKLFDFDNLLEMCQGEILMNISNIIQQHSPSLPSSDHSSVCEPFCRSNAYSTRHPRITPS